ncbi:perlucin-like protein [Anneissia japonica]|uniref:perlucin-like protein n=1 Tax=Anneissia japonica TaxID=1529436 RepID=UPI001425B00A|nr:perlucin-like protein [Anneissia japonica]
MSNFVYFCVAFIVMCGRFGYSNLHCQKYSSERFKGDEKQTWLDYKHVCEASGGYLASITTADELAAVLEYMRKHYAGVKYAIGLSRQAGLEPNEDANWKWETGEEFDSSIIPWSKFEPSAVDSEHCGVRLNIINGQIYDKPADLKTTGYICEFDCLYFQSVEPRRVTMDVSHVRCALRCLRQKACHGFHIDDAGCQIEGETNHDTKGHYAKISYFYE